MINKVNIDETYDYVQELRSSPLAPQLYGYYDRQMHQWYLRAGAGACMNGRQRNGIGELEGRGNAPAVSVRQGDSDMSLRISIRQRAAEGRQLVHCLGI